MLPAFFLSGTMAVRDEPRDVTVNGREQVLRSPPDQSPCPRGFEVYCLMAFVVASHRPSISHRNRMGWQFCLWFCQHSAPSTDLHFSLLLSPPFLQLFPAKFDATRSFNFQFHFPPHLSARAAFPLPDPAHRAFRSSSETQ